MDVIHVTTDTFEEEVLKSDKKVLVDFWAVWCGPCKMIAPVVEAIAEEREDIKVCKVDVDQNIELAKQFSVFSIPTILIFENGSVVQKSVGYVDKAQLLALL